MPSCVFPSSRRLTEGTLTKVEKSCPCRNFGVGLGDGVENAGECVAAGWSGRLGNVFDDWYVY